MSILHYLLGKWFFRNVDTTTTSQRSLDLWTALIVLLTIVGLIVAVIILVTA